MKILVAVKRVINPYVSIRVKSDHSGVESANVKMSINPFDEIAVEEAVRLKEAGIATEIVVVTIGTKASEDILRQALALGADRAILLESDTAIQALSVAKTLKVMVEKEQPNLVLMGKQSIDNENNQVGQMLAGLLNWSQAIFASKIKVEATNLLVEQEIDGGLQTLNLQLPAVVTTDLRLNEPRYASLPNIMKAKKKPLEILPLNSLGIDITSRYTTLSITPPEPRKAGIKVKDVQELVAKLRETGVIA